VIATSQILQVKIDKMIIRTLSFSKEVTKFIFDNIKEVKSHVDPCEIRVKRPNFKEKPTEIKHPFFFVPNFTQELCLLGTEEEVANG
jgi:hypothetical protein